MSKLQSAIGKKFQFKVVNGTGSDQVLALTRANFDTLGMSVTQAGTSPFGVSAVTPHYHDKTQMTTAGYPVTAVLDDGTVEIIMQADDSSQWEQSITFAKVSPLFRGTEQSVLLSAYKNVNQYDDKKIVIDDIHEVLNDEMLVYMTIGSGRTMQIIIKMMDE